MKHHAPGKGTLRPVDNSVDSGESRCSPQSKASRLKSPAARHTAPAEGVPGLASALIHQPTPTMAKMRPTGNSTTATHPNYRRTILERDQPHRVLARPPKRTGPATAEITCGNSSTRHRPRVRTINGRSAGRAGIRRGRPEAAPCR
jgi:hypothetical protein